MTVKFFTAGAFALLLPFATTARAQQAPTTTTTTQTTQTTQTPTTPTPPQNVYAATPSFEMYHNVVTGSVGGAWAGALDGGSWNFDAQYAYLQGGLGFEFIGSFMGNANLVAFDNLAIRNPIVSNNLTRENPRVNSYMFNLVTGLPMGRSATWMPFISGGIGWFHISGGRVDLGILEGDPDFDFDLLDPDFVPEFDSNGLVNNFFKDDQFGGNLGLGVFGFFDQVGLRADVRYYSGLGNTNNNLNFISQNIENIHYWRATGGVSFRW